MKPDPLKGVPREVVRRFNKVMGNEAREFRSAMGEVIARQAGNGLVMSGHTIRLCIAEASICLERGIEDCLQLIANRTKHNGRRRQAMLSVLKSVTKHQANHIARMIENRFEKIDAFQGDARVSSEFEYQQMVERRIDQIEAFSDGLTAPPDEPWTRRHPLLAGAAGAAIAIIVGSAFGLFEPIASQVLELLGTE